MQRQVAVSFREHIGAMLTKSRLIVMLACTVLPLRATLADSGAGGATTDTAQAAIPAVKHGAALADWEADEDQGLWVEDANSKWYYASFTASCPTLRLATTLNFETGPADTFDSSSSIQLPSGARCYVSSLKSSAGPDAADAAPDSSASVSTDPKLSRQ